MFGTKTNEREGTRAVLHHAGMSAYKVREVIDEIRGKPVHEADDLLRFVERGAGTVVGKLLRSAVANATNNDGLDADELYVSACYVDEGPTAKRWRPRARGRATRIRKRTSHITIIVSRMPESQLARLKARRQAENLTMRARRVEATRRARAESAEGASRHERRHPEAAAPAEATEETAEETATGTTATGAGTEGATAGTTPAEVTGPEPPAEDQTAAGAAAPEPEVEAEAQPETAAEAQPETAAEAQPETAAEAQGQTGEEGKDS